MASLQLAYLRIPFIRKRKTIHASCNRVEIFRLRYSHRQPVLINQSECIKVSPLGVWTDCLICDIGPICVSNFDLFSFIPSLFSPLPPFSLRLGRIKVPFIVKATQTIYLTMSACAALQRRELFLLITPLISLPPSLA